MFFHHQHQLTVAEFLVYILRRVIQQHDGVTIARTMKLTTSCKEHAEDELLEAPSTDIHTPSRRNSMAAMASTRTSSRTTQKGSRGPSRCCTARVNEGLSLSTELHSRCQFSFFHAVCNGHMMTISAVFCLSADENSKGVRCENLRADNKEEMIDCQIWFKIAPRGLHFRSVQM